MNILDKLGPEEEILLVLKQDYLLYLMWYIVGIVLILTISLSPLGFTLVLFAEFFRRGHTYYITNERVISEFRYLSTTMRSLDINIIERVELDYGMLGGLFGIANIVMFTSRVIGDNVEFKGIKNPAEIKKQIEEKVRKSKKSI